MHPNNGLRWFTLVVAFGFTVSTARAEMITPDSIPNPPGSVGSAAGTPVPSGNMITTQYTGLGLNFDNAAITHLNGVTVWAPVQPIVIPASEVVGGTPPSYPPPQVGYESWAGGATFVGLGTVKPTSVYSTTLEIMGAPVSVQAFNSKWQAFSSVGPSGVGPHGGLLYTISGGGITAFSVSVPVRTASDATYPAWGVAAVSFMNNPEPSSLVLAGLGALGWAARYGWRRVRMAT